MARAKANEKTINTNASMDEKLQALESEL